MPRYSRHHDVYDDTGRHYRNNPDSMSRVPVIRRRSASPDSYPAADPFMDMQGAMQRFHQDMERSFGGFGLTSMFGGDRGGGMFGSFDRMFDNPFAHMANDTRNGNGSYFFESRTRTVGPDGRVREERVRTVPDAEGIPRTRRTVRDADTERDLDPFFSGIGGRYDRRYDRIAGRHREPEIIVEEVDDDEVMEEEERRRHRGRRRQRSNHGDVEVEEIVDEPAERGPGAGDWVRDRYRRWRARH